jgi:hypothetical protein
MKDVSVSSIWQFEWPICWHCWDKSYEYHQVPTDVKV